MSSLFFPTLCIGRPGCASRTHVTRRALNVAAALMTPNEGRRSSSACRPCSHRWVPSAMHTRASQLRALRLQTSQHDSGGCFVQGVRKLYKRYTMASARGTRGTEGIVSDARPSQRAQREEAVSTISHMRGLGRRDSCLSRCARGADRKFKRSFGAAPPAAPPHPGLLRAGLLRAAPPAAPAPASPAGGPAVRTALTGRPARRGHPPARPAARRSAPLAGAGQAPQDGVG